MRCSADGMLRFLGLFGFGAGLSVVAGLGCGGTASPDGSGNESRTGAITARVVQIAVGGEHACAVVAARGVYLWGANREGQLGVGKVHAVDDAAGSEGSAKPVAVIGAEAIVEVAAGRAHACGRTEDGRVLCWGGNTYGESGPTRAPAHTCEAFANDATPSDVPCQPTPQWIDGLADAEHLAASDSTTCALRRGGAVTCGGASLGVLSESPPATAIAMGPDAGCTRIEGGRVFCRGQREQLYRTGTVLALTGIEAVAVGLDHLCFRMASGAVDCVGANASGQLGRGDSEIVSYGTTRAVDNATALAAGTNHTCALRADGTVACWGRTEVGQTGRLADPRSCSGGPCTPAAAAVDGLDGVRALAAGGAQTCVLRADGEVRCFGAHGESGIGGPQATRVEPVWGE
jgi:alpha-tubulin suppressor-like RCC1 family protein